MTRSTEVLLKSMNCNGILIADKNGVIIKVDDDFHDYYGIPSETLLNKDVFTLERMGVFRPSSVAMVLKSGKEETIIQKLKNGQEVIVTAFPIYNDQGTISKVITFSRDISDYKKIIDLYKKLTKKISHYNQVLDEISYEKAVIEGLDTNNSKFQKTLLSMQRIAKYDINILLLGETGVGKTVIAKKIHTQSNYSNGKFIEVNCGAIPENLIESELFGYEKGSFTGACAQGKVGLFEFADGGTLFLDEISELSLAAQVKLLSVLQSQEIRKVGGTETKKVDCRLITASNKDLSKAAEEGGFRQDLLYRINMVSFVIPPLRERNEDIITLSNDLLSKVNLKYGFKRIFDSSVFKAFMRYTWPGNIRELENTIHRMAITADGDIITTNELPEAFNDFISSTENINKSNISDLYLALKEYEKEIVREVYKKEASSTKLAKALNISQATAARKIKRYIVDNNN